MRELAGILALISAGALVAALILFFWLFPFVYGEADRKDPNSIWLVTINRYRRPAIAIATLYAVAVLAMILAMIVGRLAT
jgi:hypothetical protein